MSKLNPDQDVRTGADPTEAILSKSGLNNKYLCDYVINVATGAVLLFALTYIITLQ